MHPTLFKIGNFPVQSYGVLLVVGFIVAIFVSSKRAPLFGLKPDAVSDMAIPVVFSGILGARLFYIVQEWDYFSKHPEQLYSLRFDGLTSFGGFVLGGLALVAWCRIKKVSLRALIDCLAPGLLVANAIGRVGCLMNGCCFGWASNAWCAVPQGTSHDHHYLPAQLIETGLNIAFAFVLANRTRAWQPIQGTLGGMSLVFLGLGRFIYEFWRAGSRDEVAQGIASSTRIPGLPITEAQVVALLFVILGATVVILSRKRASTRLSTPEVPA